MQEVDDPARRGRACFAYAEARGRDGHLSIGETRLACLQAPADTHAPVACTRPTMKDE